MRRDRRQRHEREDREQVLHDQPADRRLALRRLQLTALLERPQQDDRARHGHGEAEHEPAGEPPAERDTQSDAEQRRHEDLADRPGHGDVLHRQQVADREVHADPEHQQDHAELGQLRRGPRVGNDAGRERPDHDARQQVADDRRQAEAVRDDAADEPGPEADGDGLDQRGRVIHPSILADATG
jgi:hypothetical protein